MSSDEARKRARERIRQRRLNKGREPQQVPLVEDQDAPALPTPIPEPEPAAPAPAPPPAASAVVRREEPPAESGAGSTSAEMHRMEAMMETMMARMQDQIGAAVGKADEAAQSAERAAQAALSAVVERSTVAEQDTTTALQAGRQEEEAEELAMLREQKAAMDGELVRARLPPRTGPPRAAEARWQCPPLIVRCAWPRRSA